MLRTMRAWSVGLTLLVGACASTPAAPPVPGPPATAAAPSSAPPLGRSPATAIPACGPGASYEYVSTAAKCADGTNPFDGDISLARAARTRSAPSGKGTTVDIYRVPCPEGPIELHVDMYQCKPGDPEYETMQQASTPPSFTDHPVWHAFVQEGLAPLEQLCKADDPATSLICVLALSSGSYLAEDRRRSADVLRALCGRIRPHEGLDPREEFVTMVAMMTSERLNRLGEGWNRKDWQDAMRLWAEACRLEEGRADQLLERLTR
jgi:hypothetical protein